MNKQNLDHIRYRTYEILEVRSGTDRAAKIFDIGYLLTIILNLAASIMYTYEKYRLQYGPALMLIENITVAMFCADYILRLFAAKYMYPEAKGCRSSSRRARPLSGCCVSCGCSGSSGSMPTMILCG